MSGECPKCGEHAVDCECDKINPDDHAIAYAVSHCHNAMFGLPTRDKMTVCYNLTEGVLRLFMVLGKKEDVVQLMTQFHEQIMQSIDEAYDDCV